jgi:hypothetical protein
MESEMNLFEGNLISSSSPHKILLGFTLIYFIFFGVFMAYTAGQPDQTPHLYYSERYSETWGIPDQDPNSSFLITDQPYLYYWMNGAIAKIYKGIFPNNPPIRVAMLWRLFSVVISTFTVFYCYKLSAKVTNNPYAGVLSAFFLANTLMFVFVSGGISYDNLMNLAAMAAIYHLVCIYKKENFVRHSALTGIWVIIGSLAKEQFLLLTLIIFLAWLFFAISNLKSIKLTFTKGNIAIGLVFILFLGLFLSLYGVNIIRYSRPTPYCSQIKPSETCNSFDGRMEYYEPYSLDALWFYRDYLPNPIEYTVEFWVFKITESIWGILSHKTFVPRLSVGLHFALVIWALACLIRYWKPEDKLSLLLLFIIVSYGGYIFYMNFKNDVNFSYQHYGITGRYFSPVFGAFFTLMIYYFLKIPSKFMKKLTLALSVMLYFTGGLWMYFSRYAEIFFHWRIFG